jgi:hypothetical protein
MRKSLILIHRYLGIALSLLFLVWFVSGIAMIYARGMPSLTPDVRLTRLPVLDTGVIRLSPLEALSKAQMAGLPDRAELLTVLDRPVYRFYSGGYVTVFADTGELLEINAERATESARLFLNAPSTTLHPAGYLTAPDQWTITERRSLPLYKFNADDPDQSELYISENTGEVALITTRGSRRLAWIAAIPHWLYFKALRTRPRLWRQVILWTSGLATVSALIGLVLGVIQYRRRPPHIPYAGWMRWHYLTGVFFGLFALTWVFSGFLSVEPWFWASDGALNPEAVQSSLQGGALDLALFPPAAPNVAGAKVIEFLVIQGDPYYRVQIAGSDPTLISAETKQARSELFSTESLMRRITAAYPEAHVQESVILHDYDAYYYSFDRRAPLPVLRVKFDDPDSTWLYVDPRMGEFAGRAHRRERLQRWIYRGLHSLDFSFWYYNRPLWDIGVIALSLGGAALSLIGVVIAWKRVSRAALRKFARDRAPLGH